MVIYAGVLTKPAVRSLNEGWEHFRTQLSNAPTIQAATPVDPSIAVLSVLAGRREPWELVVSSAGYLSTLKRKSLSTSQLEIPDIVKSIAEQTSVSLYPGLRKYIADVATVDFGRLEAVAPGTLIGVHLEQIRMKSFTCLAFCRKTFPQGGPEYENCRQQC